MVIEILGIQHTTGLHTAKLIFNFPSYYTATIPIEFIFSIFLNGIFHSKKFLTDSWDYFYIKEKFS